MAAARDLGDGVDSGQVPAAVAEVFAGRQFLSTPRDDLSDSIAAEGGDTASAAAAKVASSVERRGGGPAC